ncbi:MAG: hypothetical protein K2R98_27620 [Gemmataceae bacterium]|nr:hypothetical protein [Gemmataceae bacterium]
MRHFMAVGSSLAIAVLVSSAIGADDLKSGTPVGKNIPGPFHPLNVTGGQAGKKHCLV